MERPSRTRAAGRQPVPRGPEDTRPFDLVAFGASAGGIKALISVLGDLPAEFPVPVLVVQHLDPKHDTIIAAIFGRRSELAAKLAEAGDLVQPGVVYFAPPDRHLRVSARGVLALSEESHVNYVRPAVDVLFESVAQGYGERAVVCVLSGTGVDGARGATLVKQQGGTVVAEDPETAAFAGMPEAVVRAGVVDFVRPLNEIAGVLVGLVNGTVSR
jgi:two-component system, chemotaxis family, protein-glutamate methylesterase/glutaminase